MKEVLDSGIRKYLANYTPKLTGESEYTKAAVLLPIVDTNEGESILFEVRSEDLNWQPGEICFPGGKIEEADKDPMHTAVRETCEELSLTPDTIEVLGPLDYLATQMSVIVYPYVGKILKPELINPGQSEVAEVFCVPIQKLLKMQPMIAQMQVTTAPVTKDNFPYEILPEYARGSKPRKTYNLYFYQYDKYTIWGMTALILKGFLDIIKEDSSS